MSIYCIARTAATVLSVSLMCGRNGVGPGHHEAQAGHREAARSRAPRAPRDRSATKVCSTATNRWARSPSSSRRTMSCRRSAATGCVAGSPHPNDDPAVELLHRRRARRRDAERDAGTRALQFRPAPRGLEHGRRPDGQADFVLTPTSCSPKTTPAASAAAWADCSGAGRPRSARDRGRLEVQGSADEHAACRRAQRRAGVGSRRQHEEGRLRAGRCLVRR